MAAPAIKAIIFDCFGVLYTDTKQSLLTVVPADRHRERADLFASNNYGYFDRDPYVQQVAEITNLSVDEVEQYIAAEHHLNQPLIALIAKQLRPQGYKVGLLSNIGKGGIEQFFDTHQLHDLFDEVVLSGEEHLTKPDPGIFRLAAERLGVMPDECLMIDDIPENCDGAVAAGMGAVHYASNTQLFAELSDRGVITESY